MLLQVDDPVNQGSASTLELEVRWFVHGLWDSHSPFVSVLSLERLSTGESGPFWLPEDMVSPSHELAVSQAG